METIKLLVNNLLCRIKSKKGQTMVEYALIIVLIAILAIVGMRYMGNTVSNTYGSAANKIASP